MDCNLLSYGADLLLDVRAFYIEKLLFIGGVDPFLGATTSELLDYH